MSHCKINSVSLEEPIDTTRRRTMPPTTSLEESFEVEVNLRPTVSRLVCLGVRRPSGTRDQFFFLLEIFFRQLRVYYFVAPSLTRGRVCNLLYNCFWALSEQSLLPGSNYLRTHGHILLSHLRLPQPGEPGPRIYIPQEQGVPAIRRARFPFVASYDSQGYGGAKR
jgi:hypothetical protein